MDWNLVNGVRLMATRIIQVTDTHLFENKNHRLLGNIVFESLHAVMKSIEASPVSPSLLLLTGDLSQDYTRASYLHVAESFKKIHCPILCTLGNHDKSLKAKDSLKNTPLKFQKTCFLGNWLIIMLSSYWHGHLSGKLNTRELKFLESTLTKHPDLFKMIFLHHHAVPIRSEWMDKIALVNAKELFSIIDRHKNIQAIVSGHTHQTFDDVRKNVRVLTTPSTSFQLLPCSSKFALDPDQSPGYRFFDLSPDGSFKTGVVRCPV